LIVIGVIGIWLELKTPGFGLPGVVGIGAFLLYFLGGFVAGFSGMEWVLVFFLGMALVLIELFAFPGAIFIGLGGGLLILLALIMGMVDLYPGSPTLPSWPQLALPMRNLSLALILSVVAMLVLARWLPKTSIYSTLVSTSASGVSSVAAQSASHKSQLGSLGVTLCPLRPGGKARFGEGTVDVISQGEMIPTGEKVRIIGHSGTEAVVERC
jgi:membrane-bound serine protease (ClpP class)